MSKSDGPSTIRILNTFAERREAGVPETRLSTKAEMSLSVRLKQHPHLREIADKKRLEGFSASKVLYFLSEGGYFGKYWMKKWFFHDDNSEYVGEFFQTPREMEIAFEKSVNLKMNPYIECFEYIEESDEWVFTGIKWSSLD